VRWSNYESSRSQIEYEVRLKIAKELEKHIEEHRNVDLPEEFLIGMNRALLLVLYRQPTRVPDTDYGVQDKLF
jgi:hypothetical protein